MMETTGGARIGWVNATWPLAKLKATSDHLSLVVLFVGSYSFHPNQVISIEPYGRIPILGRGVRITHTRSDYPAHIVFWCFGRPEVVIQNIQGAGFASNASQQAFPARQGIALRWPAILVILGVWNGLFLVDRYFVTSFHEQGPFALLAIALLCFVAWTVPHSSFMQRLLLKPGRSIGELSALLGLVKIVTSLFVIFLTVRLLG